MQPAIYNFKQQYAGDTFNGIQLTIENKNLTGFLIKMQIKTAPFGAVVKDLSIDNGITIVDAVNGILRIDSFVNPITAGYYIYDMQFTNPNGVVQSYLKGQFTVIQDVTR